MSYLTFSQIHVKLKPLLLREPIQRNDDAKENRNRKGHKPLRELTFK